MERTFEQHFGAGAKYRNLILSGQTLNSLLAQRDQIYSETVNSLLAAEVSVSGVIPAHKHFTTLPGRSLYVSQDIPVRRRRITRLISPVTTEPPRDYVNLERDSPSGKWQRGTCFCFSCLRRRRRRTLPHARQSLLGGGEKPS